MKKNNENNGTRILLSTLLVILIVLPYVGAGYLYYHYHKKLADVQDAKLIVIDKQKMMLTLYDYNGIQRFAVPMACGKNYGNKQEQGDMRTPEGVFHISEIVDASTWSHDFHDGKGIIEGAYGPWFLRLETPGHSGIGIHGTHDSTSLGTRATEGCIRLSNDNILSLKKLVKSGTVVVILPSIDDIKASLAQ